MVLVIARMDRFFWRPFTKRFAPKPFRPLSVCPVFSATLVYCGQTVGWIQMKLRVQVELDTGHIVLDGDPAPPPPKGHSAQFAAHIWCGQMAEWIQMPLGREVGLGPSDIVLPGDPAPPPQKGDRTPPNFRPMSIVAKRLDRSRWPLTWRWASVQATWC